MLRTLVTIFKEKKPMTENEKAFMFLGIVVALVGMTVAQWVTEFLT